MNRWITIDHPYDRITLEFKPEHLRKQAAPLRSEQWRALESAERRIYSGDRGCHGWTDVMSNDGDEFLNSLWSHAADYVQNEDFDGNGELWQLHQTAKRVAQSLAVMAFGSEILLVG
jgi:hypothetical protein